MKPLDNLLLALCLLLFAPCALAQRRAWRDDPEAVAAARQHAVDVGHALGTARQARQALQRRKYALAEALAETAADDLTRLGGVEFATDAREVLAELALRQGDPREALRQADLCTPRLVAQRFGMTKALALLDLGRDAEARALVLADVGTPDKPGYMRRGEFAWRYPLDGDDSEAALKATAYLVRAGWWPERIEAREDIQAALALAPREPVLHLLAGYAFADANACDAARAEYTKAAALDARDTTLQERVRMANQALNVRIAKLKANAEKAASDAKAKSGGS